MTDEDVGVRYLGLDDLYDVIRFATGGEPVVRDVGLLQSALHRPMAGAFGEEAYPTIARKAAALLESLARNHGLVDGNKRSAWIATWLFLRLNGLRLPPADGAYDLVIGIAEGRIELDEISTSLEGWCTDA